MNTTDTINTHLSRRLSLNYEVEKVVVEMEDMTGFIIKKWTCWRGYYSWFQRRLLTHEEQLWPEGERTNNTQYLLVSFLVLLPLSSCNDGDISAL